MILKTKTYPHTHTQDLDGGVWKHNDGWISATFQRSFKACCSPRHGIFEQHGTVVTLRGGRVCVEPPSVDGRQWKQLAGSTLQLFRRYVFTADRFCPVLVRKQLKKQREFGADQSVWCQIYRQQKSSKQLQQSAGAELYKLTLMGSISLVKLPRGVLSVSGNFLICFTSTRFHPLLLLCIRFNH